MAAIRWTSQELTNASAVAQLAAPKEAMFIGQFKTSLRWNFQEAMNMSTAAQLTAPPGRRGLV